MASAHVEPFSLIPYPLLYTHLPFTQSYPSGRCRHSSSTSHSDTGPTLLVVLPLSLQRPVIEQLLKPANSARGLAQAFLQLRQHYWFPNMKAIVASVIGRGNAHQRSRVRNAKKSHGTLSTSQPAYIRQELAMDIMDTADSRSQYPYALVAVYSFSRYPYVIPLKSPNNRNKSPTS